MTSDVYQINTAEQSKTFFANVTKLLNDKFVITGTLTPTQFKKQEEYLAAANKKVAELNVRAEKEPEFKKLIQTDLDKLEKLIEQDTDLLGKNASLVSALSSPSDTKTASQADTKKTSSSTAPAPKAKSEMEKKFNEGKADAESHVDDATKLGKDLFDGKSDKKTEGTTTTDVTTTEEEKKKKKEEDKNKKPFDWGALIGGLLGAGGGWFAGNIFGNGWFGKIAGACLAVGGFFMGQKFSDKINGLLGRSGSSKPDDDAKKKEKQLELEKGKTPEEIEQLKAKAAADESKAAQEKIARERAEHQQIYDAYQKETVRLDAKYAENHSQVAPSYGDGSFLTPSAPGRHSSHRRG